MIEYIENGDIAVIDGYKFRRDKKTGYYLSSRKINGARKRLHVYIWEKFNGEIPKDYEIHHKDHNKNNNDIDNFELLTEKEHHKRHSDEITEEQKRTKQINLEKARPKASEWHKSEQGRNWHKQHYNDMKDKLHQTKEFVCTMCGKTFTAKISGKNKFCSNNCKSAYRRKLGIDNIEMRCMICGKPYFTNKYSPAKYCNDHKSVKYRIERAS